MAVVAAAIVAFAARPSRRGPAEEYLVGGRLFDDCEAEGPELQVECADSGEVILVRRDVEGVADDGALSLAIEVAGSDIRIEERLTPGRMAPACPKGAEFELRFLKPGYYHVRYNSQATGFFTAFTLHVAPGIRTSKPLTR